MNIINDVLVNKLFKDPPKRTKEIPLLSEKTASGDGMVIINDAYSDFPITNLTLRGKSEQVTTTGKNLFDYKDFVDINTYIDNTGNYRRKYLQLKPNTSYRITIFKNKMTGSLDRNVMFIGDKETYDNNDPNGNIVFFSSADAKKSATIATKESGQIVVKLNKNSTPDLQEEYLSQADIIISEGKDEIPYEPYTGGKPSPSPEYPQEIRSVGKYNELTGKYEVDVKVKGKNLFNKNAAKQGYEFGSAESDGESTNQKWFVSDFMPVKATTYQISGKKTGAGCKLYNKDKVFVKNIQCPFGGIKFDEGIVYFRINGEIKDLDKIQVEEGGTPTLYEPYKEQTLTLTSDRPITKWDRLVEQGGQIGWLYQSAIDEYSGETNVSPYKTGFGFYFLLENKNIESGEGYCEELQQYTSEKVPCIHFNLAKNTYVYTLNTETIYGSTVSDIKNYLKTHPLHIVYKTETTEFVPLPQSEQDAIRALKTYYPTTVITTDGGELPVGIEVTYMHPEYIPTKQSALRMWFKENPII